MLIVDDTIENLRLLSTMLGSRGFEVRPVTSGRHALQAAETDPPDLVLLDINMPEMDGYEVCRRLKELEQVRDVPIIYLTALSDTDAKLEAFRAGGVDYITKPFQLEEVLARVQTHATLRQAQSRLSESYERLQGLEKLRDDLVHMLVHDMRSPMTVLLAHLGFILTDTQSLGEGVSTDVEKAIKAAKTVNRMASDLLDLSRLEEGKMPIERQRCDLTEVVSELATAIAAIDRTRTIELVTSESVHTACDRGLVYRVVENLVHNAVKHTPQGSKVSIGVERSESHSRVWVQDQGPGVPPEARERIFDKFGTLATRKDSGFHSVGLGLAFCKLAVAAHGGAIGVEPGQVAGSVFWFTLPS